MTVVHGAYDFTITRAPITLILTIFQCLLFLMVVGKLDKNYTEATIIRLIIIAFVVQSVIQILGFWHEDALSIIRLFQDDQDALLMEQGYAGVRGLAISSELSFALASGYGLCFILLAFYTNFDVSRRFIAVCFLLLLIGSLFAGRTAFVGLAFSILLYLHCNLSSFRKIFGLITWTLIFLIILIYFIRVYGDSDNAELLRFAFEFIFSYMETGELSTESSTSLLNNHLPVLMRVNFYQLIHGDGFYTNPDGSYYMHSDSGFVRDLYFGGVIFLMYKLIAQFVLNFSWTIFNKKNRNSSKMILFNAYSFFYLVILHIKGDSLVVIKMCIMMIFIINAARVVAISKVQPMNR